MVKRTLKYGVQVICWVTKMDRDSFRFLANREGLTMSCYFRRLIRKERRKIQ